MARQRGKSMDFSGCQNGHFSSQKKRFSKFAQNRSKGLCWDYSKNRLCPLRPLLICPIWQRRKSVDFFPLPKWAISSGEERGQDVTCCEGNQKSHWKSSEYTSGYFAACSTERTHCRRTWPPWPAINSTVFALGPENTMYHEKRSARKVLHHTFLTWFVGIIQCIFSPGGRAVKSQYQDKFDLWSLAWFRKSGKTDRYDSTSQTLMQCDSLNGLSSSLNCDSKSVCLLNATSNMRNKSGHVRDQANCMWHVNRCLIKSWSAFPKPRGKIVLSFEPWKRREERRGVERRREE